MATSRVLVAGILVSIWTFSTLGGEVLGFSPCQFPAIYNFGDSNSDTGGISAAFWPTTPPNGESFFHGPAGRASDGRLIVDFIAEHLGLPYLSAYLNSVGANFRHGTNFATGGSTIRRQNETFFEHGVSPFSLDIQIVQYDHFKQRTSDLYSQAKKSSNKMGLPLPQDFSKALYTFDIGQNDLAAGFRTLSMEQLKMTIPDMVNQLARAVENLYQQGARTFWIQNTGPIGCLPASVMYITNPPPGFLDQNGCVKGQNDMAAEFNRQLKDKVIKLRTQLPQAAITYVDVFSAKYGLISNAKREGFFEPLKICCGYHHPDGHVWCGQRGFVNGTEVLGASCGDPSAFISWDGVHYSQTANHWVADHILMGSLSDPPIPIAQACQKHLQA
ncbi:GDSL esterase/lipase At5g14450 [Malania oleifera]|uniref:GDSL esterase/lipase At5g14450 n=1 Tax=Malania oleifera TaxID=397392 RepID=UPI0025AE749F|nr:GDSL esterase/lipase At5g14450 [Malania oleifera]